MTAIRPVRLVLPFIVLLAAFGKSSAADIIWTNTTGGNWDLAANWNPNHVPVAGDNAIITNAGTYTVNMLISTIVGGLTLGGGSGSGTQTFVMGNSFGFGGGTGTINGGGVFELSSVFNGPGTFEVTAGGTLSFKSLGFQEVRSTTFINAGTVNWISGVIYYENGSVFTNLPGALFDVKCDSVFSTLGSPTDTNVFVNLGTFRKSAGAGAALITEGSGRLADFINNGTVSAQSGLLNFGVGGGGGGINFTNSTGTIAVSGGNSIQFSAPLILPGGLITGSGTVIAPSITSVGATVSPGMTNAVLAISGNYIQQIGGSMEFDIGGTSPGTNQSQVNVTGSAKLDGIIGLRFSGGYSPAVGSSNVILTAGSRSGQFRFQNYFFLLGQNKRMSAIYNPANVVVSTLSAPDPANFSLSVGVSGQTFAAAWPAEFTGNSLYLKTNLINGAWMLIPGVTNLYVENPMNANQKFFQLIHN